MVREERNDIDASWEEDGHRTGPVRGVKWRLRVSLSLFQSLSFLRWSYGICLDLDEASSLAGIAYTLLFP